MVTFNGHYTVTLSTELIAMTLMMLPICGLALCRRMKSNEEYSGLASSSSEAETIFKAALQRFKIFTDVPGMDSPETMGVVSNILPVDVTVDYSHQVAGHTCEVLRGFRGKVLKPMVKRRLFIRELSLYETMSQHPISGISGLPKEFVPNYNGLAIISSRDALEEQNMMECSILQFIRNILCDAVKALFLPSELRFLNHYHDKRLLPHLVLDDMALNFKSPCVIDIKMGQQTYEPGANISKKRREIRKCPYQIMMGFRITGMKVINVTDGSYTCQDKQFGRSVKPDDVSTALKQFFFNGVLLRKDVIHVAIERLEEILVWFENQTSLHFYCSSILIIYDGSTSCNGDTELHRCHQQSKNENENYCQSSAAFDLVKVKMIDFAHTLPSPFPQEKDHGYILGMKNLICKLREMVD